ncbi:hypothetical protein P9112_007612 [Eukaryota sp. TZLM1-RC]
MSYSDEEFESYVSDFESCSSSNATSRPHTPHQHLQQIIDAENASITSSPSPTKQLTHSPKPSTVNFVFTAPSKLSKSKQKLLRQKYNAVTSVVSFDYSTPFACFSLNVVSGSALGRGVQCGGIGLNKAVETSIDVCDVACTADVGFFDAVADSSRQSTDDDFIIPVKSSIKSSIKCDFKHLSSFVTKISNPILSLLHRSLSQKTVAKTISSIELLTTVSNGISNYALSNYLLAFSDYSGSEISLINLNQSREIPVRIKLPCKAVDFSLVSYSNQSICDYLLIGVSEEGCPFVYKIFNHTNLEFAVIDGIFDDKLFHNALPGRAQNCHVISRGNDWKKDCVEFAVLSCSNLLGFYTICPSKGSFSLQFNLVYDLMTSPKLTTVDKVHDTKRLVKSLKSCISVGSAVAADSSLYYLIGTNTFIFPFSISNRKMKSSIPKRFEFCGPQCISSNTFLPELFMVFNKFSLSLFSVNNSKPKWTFNCLFEQNFTGLSFSWSVFDPFMFAISYGRRLLIYDLSWSSANARSSLLLDEQISFVVWSTNCLILYLQNETLVNMPFPEFVVDQTVSNPDRSLIDQLPSLD